MRVRQILINVSILGLAKTAYAEEAAPGHDATNRVDAVAVPASAPGTTPAADATVTPAVAAPSAETGKFVVGLRLGYGLPMGSVSKPPDGSNGKLSNVISGQFPIWIDLGYNVTPNIMVGLYGQYGFGRLGSGLRSLCDTPPGPAFAPGLNCSVSDIRVGVQGQYHVSPSEKLDPWFGLGIGYEIAKTKLWRSGGTDLTVTTQGFELANLQAGVDYKLVRNFGIGPFVSFSLGQFNSTSASAGTLGVPGASDITDKTLHEWLTIGVRGALGI